MSTVEFPRDAYVASAPSAASDATTTISWRALVAPLASLRLTVTLLALSLFLVLAGTLAQIDRDVWYVLKEYFRTWYAWIPLQVFLPRSWELPASIGFPFFGGKAIGVALAVNLFAAHAVRFKIVARGRRLLGGWALVALGALVTYAVIASGSDAAVESELSPQLLGILWHSVRAALGGATLTLAYFLALSRPAAMKSQARWLWRLGAVLTVVLGALVIYLFTHLDARLDAAGLRILWQLAKAGGASLILGLGCWALFGVRAGIVLLHSGIALLMLSELLYAGRSVESQMRIAEGQTVDYADDMRTAELVLFDLSDPAKDTSVVIPAAMLADAAESKQVLDDPALPYAIRVFNYYPNATSRLAQPGEESPATAGLNQLRILESVAESTGVDTQQAFDVPGAYVELLEKSSGDARAKSNERKSLGVYLATPFRTPDEIAGSDGAHRVALRFKRIAKPYKVTLLDFKFDKYAGSDTPKNFESIVRFEHPEHSVDRTLSISMNNPLRYAGDTLYQADWDKETEAGTVLQVVTNPSWMIPYVACMIVAAGMLVHFSQAIVRFVARRDEEAKRTSLLAGAPAPPVRAFSLANWRRAEMWVPALIVLLFAGYAVGRAQPKREKYGEMQLAEFGQLPVAFGGRVQPLDSLARNTLRTISGRASYDDATTKSKEPAIRWLLDVVSQSPAMAGHQVIRVENLDVLQALGLKPRSGFRYSFRELLHDVSAASDGELQRQAALAAAVPRDQRDLTQQKFLEASAKVQQILMLRSAFNVPNFGDSQAEVAQRLPQIARSIEQLNALAPRVVPPETPDAPWTTIYEGAYQLVRRSIDGGAASQAENSTSMLIKLLDAYKDGDAAAFNFQLADYRREVEKRAAAEEEHEASIAVLADRTPRKTSERLVLDRLAFESWFNHFDPFVVCLVFYIVALVLASLAWLAWPAGFNRAANWLLWFTFAIHTVGLVCRIYISGRPPVTNLYSSAVFIGWAGVGMALVFESIYRLGLGNMLAAMLGFPTMIIAYYLSFDGDGDTIGVMQAVLDTNFWLGTHVVCITLGYATTFVAGLLGLGTLIGGYLTERLTADQRRQLTRMTYGSLCFAIFFSFVGTILGGLWADDSWGRFWGWDPKENGALMIVLWNALVLHARWGKLCGERGLAALAVGGNIVTAWSWFGVNQMGVGLHAYGFTEGRTAAIALFMVSQAAIVAATYSIGAWKKTPQNVGQAF